MLSRRFCVLGRGLVASRGVIAGLGTVDGAAEVLRAAAGGSAGAGYETLEGDGGARWEEWRVSDMPGRCESVDVAGWKQARLRSHLLRSLW